jgi:hypothetical protein
MQNMTAHQNSQATRVKDLGLPMPQRAGRPVWMSSVANATNLTCNSCNEYQATVLSNTRLDHLSLEQMLVGRGNPANLLPPLKAGWTDGKSDSSIVVMNVDPDQPELNLSWPDRNLLSLEQMLLAGETRPIFSPAATVRWTNGKPSEEATNVSSDPSEQRTGSDKNGTYLRGILL